MRQKTVSEKIFSKKIIAESESALRAYWLYKRANKILDKIKVASGEKGYFRLKNASTVNITLQTHGIRSTQKI